mmetsp:Transcript_12335/g.23585  ORF Transcript_12335/g.23585 Transcript_12335/m.23585 type:complete len:160 (+) Transcript_12335:103-582(+)|eukprot:scaffold10312_cov149-Amphora_coffeaeformis.AAC.1
MGEVEIRKDHCKRTASASNTNAAAAPSENSCSSGSRSTMNTSVSTLLSDPLDVFHHSITDLESFSNSLDINSHLPSADEREEFLAGLMDEEEINPNNNDNCEDDDQEGSFQSSFGSSFAYDLERSVPTRLGTIIDDYFSEEEEEEDMIPDSFNKVAAKA